MMHQGLKKNGEARMKARALVKPLIGFALLAWAAASNAANFRSYLSVSGNDANPCTLGAPCRLLPAALATVIDGGEIWMLDSANFNGGPVSITKSVTILAVPGALGSVVANGGNALNVTAPGARVTLRNLVILNVVGSGNAGVSFTQGAALTVEGCELYGLDKGVSASAAAANIVLKDSTIRDVTGTGVELMGAVRAQLRNVSVLNSLATGVLVANGAALAMASSAISGGGTGLLVSSAGSTTTQASITGTTVSGNVTGVQVSAATGSDTAQAMLNSVSVTLNTTGVSISGATAAVFTRQNNAFKFNTTDVGSGSLTPLAAQ
jgi:hypothetical protein